MREKLQNSRERLYSKQGWSKTREAGTVLHGPEARAAQGGEVAVSLCR